MADESTIELAKLVAEMPNPKEDTASIEEWAESLSRDLCSQPRMNYAELMAYIEKRGLKTDFEL